MLGPDKKAWMEGGRARRRSGREGGREGGKVKELRKWLLEGKGGVKRYGRRLEGSVELDTGGETKKELRTLREEK